jgi:hypothetical protein
MPRLVLGPALRYVDETRATVWVETDTACSVSVLGRTVPTFEVRRHHYALVCLDDLEPGCELEYEVALDGEAQTDWIPEGFPAPVIRTPSQDEPARIAFGSCRVAVPHEPPYSLRKDQDDRGREIDALHVLALRMKDQPREEWPTRLFMLGDQVYADEVSPRTREFIRARRSVDEPPGEDIADFEEYTRLYLESWGEPVMRWLMATMATAMVFDDHDVVDDWNISESWYEDMQQCSWWESRISGAFMSYWIYQHIGNLAPDTLSDDVMWGKVTGADGDTGDMLQRFGSRADDEVDGTRWSFARDYGGVRVVVIDSRAGRVLDPDKRSMVDPDEWEWICERLVGGPDHLVVATTLPVLLGHGMHFGEAWNEAVCSGAWGSLAARLGEKVRQALDMEHWAAFGRSFEALTTRLREVAAGEHGPPPASITILSGDVHHAYLSEVAFPRSAGVTTPVYQAVCSPFRNPLDSRERRMIRFATSKAGHVLARALARTAGVRDPDLRWRMIEGPYFDNQVATLELHGRRASLTLERTAADDADLDREPELVHCFTRRLA